MTWARSLVLAVAAALLFGAGHAGGYPLDGAERTGIRRLLGYKLALEGKIDSSVRVPPGGRLGMADIGLRLQGVNEDFDIGSHTPRDPYLQSGLERMFADRDPSYSIALLEISDPKKPRYAALREHVKRIPGSVGKLLVATGLFGALKDLYPSSIEARERLLRETIVVAGDFIHRDWKTVPFFDPGDTSITRRQLKTGDKFNLWEWLDHMLSVSSNAAGSVCWKQALLLKHFGKRYPPSEEEETKFLQETPKAELSAAAVETLEKPLRESGLDTGRLRLGTFFTRNASAVIPGSSSYASPSELLRWLIKMEQGKLVDAWTSLELKRLIYFSRPRYRYASSTALAKAAVFFKSGSLFRCKEEPGFTCKPYAGNVTNLMHSVAIIESGSKIYLVAMMSNVLRVNGAVEHQTIAGEIENLIQSRR